MLPKLTIIQYIAIAIYLLYDIVVAFGWSIKLKKVTLGTQTTIILPALIVLVFLLSKPQIIILPNSVMIIGLVLMVLSIELFSFAQKHIKANNDDFWAAKHKPKKRFLVTSGPYSGIRHPIYTAFFLLYLGLLLNIFHWVSLTLFLLLIIGLVFQAKQGEKFMTSLFPDYIAYKQRAKMFIPKVV